MSFAPSMICATISRRGATRCGTSGRGVGVAETTGSAATAARASARLLRNALDDDPVGLDRHLDPPLPGPVLAVDGIVLDRRIEPETVAVLVAVVEGGLHRRTGPLASSASAASAAPAAAPPSAGLVLPLLGAGAGLGLLALALGLGFLLLFLLDRLAQRLDLGLDLVAKLDLAGLLVLG